VTASSGVKTAMKKFKGHNNKYIRQILLKGEIDNSTILVRNFNTPLETKA